jgi:hydroxypyruvate reductase
VSGDPRRRLLLDLLTAALARVDGRASTRAALAGRSGTRPVHLAAIGKAAGSMALGAHDALGERIVRSLVITKDGHAPAMLGSLPGLELLETAHPVPDSRSLAAGARLLRWADELPPEAEPIVLVSGGASSLVEALVDGATLDDLVRLNRTGLAAGIDIAALNAQRASLSRLKGGKLARRLAGRDAAALFISDVPGDDPDVIGSGLMGRTAGAPDDIERRVVASVEDAVSAAAVAAVNAGLRVVADATRFDGDAARLAVRFVHELTHMDAQAAIWGGESTMSLPSHPGRGGRNQHLALAAARLIAGDDDLLLMAAGTDGTDGPTSDAGAIVDGETCARLAVAEIDAEEALRAADSGTALAASGDLIDTGPTGTNVGDLVIALRMRR